MTIDEAKQLKQETEKKICTLLMDFHEKTGLFVTNHGIEVYLDRTISGRRTMSVNANIQASL